MSVILICRKFLESKLKPKLPFTFINGFKTHCKSRPQIVELNNKPDLFIKRHLFQWFRKPKKSQLKEIDNIPEQYQLIFRNTVERYIMYAQFITTIASAIIVVVVLTMYGSPKHELTFYSNAKFKPVSDPNDVHLYCAFFFVFIVAIQLLISRLPLRIYYLSQQKKYIFILPTGLPLQTRRLVCKVGDVEKLPVKGFLPTRDAKFIINKDKVVFLNEDNFKTPADLYIMLGIQRDPDDVDN